MVSENLLAQYARLIIKSGVNIQPGQLLIINSPVHCADFALLCAQEAYQLGAEEVQVDWSDERFGRLDATYAKKEVLQRVPNWLIDRKQEQIDRHCAYLSLDSRIPDIMEGTDSQKMQEVLIHRQQKLKRFQYYTAANHGQWSIAAVPNSTWAKKVFPLLSPTEAETALWKAILSSVYVDGKEDPVAVWKRHSASIQQHCERLNALNFKALHFKNSLGTDLTVELIQDHIWAGGMETTLGGIPFNPNMPTEEVFTMPLKTGVNGMVTATKPLNYQGKLIKNFTLTFENGKAVKGTAEVNEEALHNLLSFDQGSCYLGEVALISHDSPISRSGILFYDTLFDENASCHLALGRAYPMNLKGGTAMSEQKLAESGSNLSMIHVDFMFGSADMEIDGICQDGTSQAVFRQGNFVF